MYLASNVHITFPEHRGRKAFKFKSCSSFRTDCSWKHLTDTCEFVIAKQLYFSDKARVFELVKAGDPFYIEAGYNGEYNREFTGYVSEVLDDLPVIFKGEDNMYLLKRTAVNKVFNNATLGQILKSIVPKQFKIKCADVKIGTWVFPKYTVAQVLQELKDKCGIYSYFVGDTLVSGLEYVDNPQNQTVNLQFNKNVISNDLRYRNKSDYPVKVVVISHLSDGKRKKVTVGDPDGVLNQLVTTGVNEESELRKLAQKTLAKLQYDGYRGTMVTFGIPFIAHGYTANIVNLQNEDRTGNYYVDRVITEFTNQGAIRRTCTLGPKAA